MPPSKRPRYLHPVILLFLVLIAAAVFKWLPPRRETPTPQPAAPQTREYQKTVVLPAPSRSGRLSLEQAFFNRRSRRSYQDRALTLRQVSQLLWAAQGVTTNWGARTAPSAKEAYPLSLYLIALKVDSLEPGIYQYIPGEQQAVHQLGLLQAGDFKEQTTTAGVQSQFTKAPVVLVIAGDFEKTAKAFDHQRRDNNVYLEAGHVGQNIYLQVESLGLGTVATGGFSPDLVRSLLQLPVNETPIYLFPVGYIQE